MAAYPSGRFVQDLSRRTRLNLWDIEQKRPVSFDDTALISSLLAVFALPHERADDETFMEDLLLEYREHPLEAIVKVLRDVPSTDVCCDEGNVPKSVGDIPRFLRNAVAHMNIIPRSADEKSLTHLVVWNKHPRSQKTTFVASIDVAKLRGLALHVLDRLSNSHIADRYNGIDPVAKFDADHPELADGGA